MLRRYSDTAGEVEARDTQSRMRMSEAERRQIIPDISGIPQHGRSSTSEFLDMLRKMGYSEGKVQQVKGKIENGQSENGENHQLIRPSESREGRASEADDGRNGGIGSKRHPNFAATQRYTGYDTRESSSGRNTVTDSGRASLRTSGGVNLNGARTLDEYIAQKYGSQPAAPTATEAEAPTSNAAPDAETPVSDASPAAEPAASSDTEDAALERTVKSERIQKQKESRFVRELGELFRIPKGERRDNLRQLTTQLADQRRTTGRVD